jgi:hypothetical protein
MLPPWSRYSALVLAIGLGISSAKVNQTDESQQLAYRALFNHQLSENSIAEIREATNKSWVGQ